MDLGSTLPPPQLQPSRRGVSASFRFKKTTQRLVEIWVQICTIPTCHQDSNGNAAWQFESWKSLRKQRLWRWTWMDLYININIWDYGKCQTYWIDSNYSIWLCVRANIVTQCTCKTTGMWHVMACVIYGISFITHNHNLALQRAPCCSM